MRALTNCSQPFDLAQTPGRIAVVSVPEGGLPPLESVEGADIKAAAQKYGIEFVGPLPEGVGRDGGSGS
jgi:hypothetical protein